MTASCGLLGEMGGTATHQVRALTVSAQKTAAHQSESAPALIAEMPDDFQVSLRPLSPLSLVGAPCPFA